jgi:hypothetical protein
MTQHVDTVVRRSITVAASQQRAFEVFTAQFGTWWPKDYHIGEAEMADFIVEPKVGGRWYEHMPVKSKFGSYVLELFAKRVDA